MGNSDYFKNAAAEASGWSESSSSTSNSYGKDLKTTKSRMSTVEAGFPEPKRNLFGRIIDSYKPAVIPEIDSTGMTEEEMYHARLAAAPLHQTLKTWQITFLAIGGSIGSGLFVGSGNDLMSAGPGGVIVSFVIIGVMLFFMMHSLGEVSVRFPVQGSFALHSMRLIDDSWGFAMSWMYVIQWLVCFPLELTAAAIILGYWKDDNNGATNVNPAAWVALFWFVLSAVGISGTQAYANVEASLSLVKVVAIVGFCIFGIVCAAGGGPTHHYFGTHYWHDPGSFTNGVKGTVYVFVNAAFAMSGIEAAGLASAESEDPGKALPRAVKQSFWRINLFYIISLTICFCLVAYNDPRLGTSEDGKASPFVLAIVNSGVKGLPSVFNVVILLSSLSVANSAIYGSSRTIAAIANAGGAPEFLGYLDRSGRPIFAILVPIIFGLIGFIVASPAYNPAFLWMQAISGQSTLFTWGSICLNHIVLRVAMKKQGRSLKEQYYTSPYGVIGSAIGFAIVIAILGLQFWTGIFPFGSEPSAENFFEVWLSLPICLFLFTAHKLWFRRKPPVPGKVDIITGARVRTVEEIEEYEEEKAMYKQSTPLWKRLVKGFIDLQC